MDSRTSINAYYTGYNQRSDKHAEEIFMSALAAIKPDEIHLLDSAGIAANLNHSGIISVNIPAPTESGLHLDTSLYTELSRSAQIPDRVEFETRPLLALGREDSRHKVFFGGLSLHNTTNNTDHNINVAVKPYTKPGSQRRAMHEYAMYEYLDQSNIDAPKQLGILACDDVGLFLISEFVPDVITLDSLDWPKLDEVTTRDAIQRGIETLVVLHEAGIFHGDSEFRNLTLQPQRHQNWIVDVELAVSLANYDTLVDPVKVIQMAIGDLSKVMTSLRQYGILDSSLPAASLFEVQYELVIKPYRELIDKIDSDSPFIANLRAQSDLIEQYFYSVLLKNKH